MFRVSVKGSQGGSHFGNGRLFFKVSADNLFVGRSRRGEIEDQVPMIVVIEVLWPFSCRKGMIHPQW